MKPLRVEPEADAELSDAVAWYEKRQRGLGADLMAAMSETLDRIAETPDAFPLVRRSSPDLPARQAHVRRFPYRVIYFDLPEAVHVLAFAHLRRRPFYWRDRGTG